MSNHTSEPPLKTCRTCGIEKPANRDNFYAAPRNRDGLDGRCKSCESARVRTQQLENPERTKAWAKKSRANHRDKRNAESRQWFAEHPDYRREWDKNNPDKAKEYKRRTRAKHKDSIREYNRLYHILNRDFLITRMANRRTPEGWREYHQQWRESHPEAVRVASHRRRSRKLEADGDFSKNDIELLYKSQKGLCWWCGKTVTKYHVDHRIPLARGGSNNPDNLCISCPTCNLSKNDKMPWEWNGRLL